jgi:hypothetical protein
LWRFRPADDEDAPSRDEDLKVLSADQYAQAEARLAEDVRATPVEELGQGAWAFSLVSVVGRSLGPEATLGVLRVPELLAAVLESPGTELRPLTDGGVSLRLQPLVEIAGEQVVELLHDLVESGLLTPDVNDALVTALERQPEKP